MIATVTPRSLLLVVRLHRVEVALAALASVVVGVAALYVTWRLGGLSVPEACFRVWNEVTPDTEYCLAYLTTVGTVYNEEAARVYAIMAILPAALGLLAGVPIVGRELEAGTAEFAWSIAPSRRRWLLRQAMGLGILLAVAFGFTAAASGALEASRRVLMPATPFEHLGLYGITAFARMLAAFGLGLLLGALTGRTLPAFAGGAIVMAGLIVAAGFAREGWAALQPTVVVDPVTDPDFDGEVVGIAWLDPSGAFVSYADAHARVPSGVDGDPDAWLWDNGYRQVQLGITRSTAEGWQSLEVAGWLVGALAMVGATAWVVDRRRPV
ncbi:MAG TPA: hypothetical protein VNO86_12150 [Candidatus Binatia bacterium]|nr:hypothetical protein [Candidatus Binatia bacterium]